MNTAKELAKIVQARKARDAKMFYARQYAGPWANLSHHKPGVAKRNVRDQVKGARKENHKLVALLRIGRARPVSLVMAALMTRIEDARRGALAFVAHEMDLLATALVTHRGNVNAIAPEMPRGDIWNRRYQLEREIAMMKRSWVFSVTKATVENPERHYEPEAERAARESIREIDPEGIERFTRDSIEDAEYTYLEFVFKMDAKVGEAAAARMHDKGLWYHSHLIVTKPDGSEVIWFTQQIENRSKLGKYFPQWPSRIVKEIKP